MKLLKGTVWELHRSAEMGGPKPERVPQLAYLVGGLAMRKIQYGWMILHGVSGYKLLDVIGKKELALRVLASLLENYPDWETAAWGFEADPVAPPEVYRAVQIAARVMFPDLPPVKPDVNKL